MLNSFKKKIQIRKYRERDQPEWNKKKGHLEKKIDYKKRAKKYHEKEDMINKLKLKASLKNPNEFYFKMISSRMENGQHTKIKKNDNFDEKEFKIFAKDKNINVLKLQNYRLSILKRK